MSMDSTRAKPSSPIALTVPVPSTWPCTTWPPRRSPARSGSSRLTASPARRVPSAERASVSRMTSARMAPSSTALAVRQTPFTASESPALSSRASCVRSRSVAPPAPSSSAETLPRSEISPVNTSAAPPAPGSPLAQACADQQVLADALAVERERAWRLGDVLHARALQRVAGAAAAEQQRREEETDFIDLAGIEEGTGQARTSLEHRRGHALRAELVERRAYARGLILAGGDEHLRPRRFQRVRVGVRCRSRDDHRQRHRRRGGDQL